MAGPNLLVLLNITVNLLLLLVNRFRLLLLLLLSLLLILLLLLCLLIIPSSSQEDIELMVTTCPGLRKVNLVVHYKMPMLDDTHGYVWEPLLRLKHLVTRDVT